MIVRLRSLLLDGECAPQGRLGGSVVVTGAQRKRILMQQRRDTPVSGTGCLFLRRDRAPVIRIRVVRVELRQAGEGSRRNFGICSGSGLAEQGECFVTLSRRLKRAREKCTGEILPVRVNSRIRVLPVNRQGAPQGRLRRAVVSD